MKLVLTTHNLTLTEAIEQHLLDGLDKLEHLDRWAIDARVTLEHDHSRIDSKPFVCAIRLGVRGKDVFAESKENDLYVAMDNTVKKLQQQLRTRHSKTKARKHKIGARAKRSLQEKD